MARPKKTADYLKELQNKGYRRYDELFNLYDRWKKKCSIKAFSDFLGKLGKGVSGRLPFLTK